MGARVLGQGDERQLRAQVAQDFCIAREISSRHCSNCEIEIDRRILPEDDFDAAFHELKTICAEADGVELLTGTPGFSAPESGAGARAFTEAIYKVTGKPPERLNVVGASDARYFARDGIEILVTGPGDGADRHMPNESVPLEEIVDAALIQLAAAERLLGLQRLA